MAWRRGTWRASSSPFISPYGFSLPRGLHRVANMYYVPADIFAKADHMLAAASGLFP
ncbi:MAG: hypothetical protein ACLSAH_10905 [Bilophila wadsworthia]